MLHSALICLNEPNYTYYIDDSCVYPGHFFILVETFIY